MYINVSTIPLKIFSLNMDWASCLPQTDLSPSVCFQIHWPWLFCLACLHFAALSWLDELIFLGRYSTTVDRWVTPRNNCILTALLVIFFCCSNSDFCLSSQQMWLRLDRNKYYHIWNWNCEYTHWEKPLYFLLQVKRPHSCLVILFESQSVWLNSYLQDSFHTHDRNICSVVQ